MATDKKPPKDGRNGGKSAEFFEQAAQALPGFGIGESYEETLARAREDQNTAANPAPAQNSTATGETPMANANDDSGSKSVMGADGKEQKRDETLLNLVSEVEEVPREEVLEKIQKLIGMDPFKKWISALDETKDYDRAAKILGLAEPAQAPTADKNDPDKKKKKKKKNKTFHHMVLIGNPGTGKSTAAELYCQYLRSSERMKGALFFKVSAGDIVSPFVGATAHALKELFNRGKKEGQKLIIHIDEAYALAANSHGNDAIAEIVNTMTEEAGRVVFVLSGYKGPMAKMLKSNPGMLSRVRITIDLGDYDDAQLLEIFKSMLSGDEVLRSLSVEAESEILKTFAEVREIAGAHFGNGRVAEVLLMNMGNALKTRISKTLKDYSDEKLANLAEGEKTALKETMMTFTDEDVRHAAEHMKAQAQESETEEEQAAIMNASPAGERRIQEIVVKTIASMFSSSAAGAETSAPAAVANDAGIAPAAADKPAAAPGGMAPS